MNKVEDVFKLAVAGFIVFSLVIIVLAILSLPFAFIGLILLLAVKIFTDVTITYMSCVVLGLAVAITGSLMSR